MEEIRVGIPLVSATLACWEWRQRRSRYISRRTASKLESRLGVLDLEEWKDV